MSKFTLIWLVVLGFETCISNSSCDSLYTTGGTELCTINTSDFSEECSILSLTNITIAATNGLSISPFENYGYVIISETTTNGVRSIIEIDLTSKTILNRIRIDNSIPLSGLIHDCNNNLYGITGKQNDHSLYKVILNNNNNTASTIELTNIPISNMGIGITYNINNDKIYILTGFNCLIKLEELKIYNNNNTAIITNNLIISNNTLNNIRAIGYKEGSNLLWFIDSNEGLYQINVDTGNYTNIYNLSNTRNHKGIICSDYNDVCSDDNNDDSSGTRFGLYIIIYSCLFCIILLV